jgi:hypothetical protein
MYIVSKSVMAHSLLWFTPIQCIEREENPTGLTPKCGLISAETIECKIRQIGQTQKAAGELDGFMIFHFRVGLSSSKQGMNSVGDFRNSSADGRLEFRINRFRSSSRAAAATGY